MKSQALLLAELRSRDLEDVSRKIAQRHHVTLDQVCEPSHESEVVKARHAIWIWQIEELGTLAAVARLWGVDRSAMLGAEVNKTSPIVYVLLDAFQHGDQHYRLSFFAGRAKSFVITNVDAEHSSWFATYEAARVVWRQVLDLAGVTFRAVSNGAQLEGQR